MNTDILEETDYDVAIAGSGLEESFLAGALARSGLRVLHLDENEFYGGDWGTVNLKELISVVEDRGGEVVQWDEGVAERERRGWNIDLSPKGVVSGGGLVQTLIDSNVGRYLEFKRVDKSLVWLNGKFADLPAGRSAVFSSTDLAPMEKRRLMQLMQLIAPDAEPPTPQPIQTYLTTTLKMTDKLKNLVLYPLLRLNSPDEPCTTTEAISRLKKIAESVGVYGPTDMIYCNYGVSELAQAMCRVCAIYRGVYILKRAVSEVAVGDDGKVCGVKCSAGQEFTVNHVVTSKGRTLNGVKGPGVGESRVVLIYTGEKSIFPERIDEDGDVLDCMTVSAVIPPSSLAPNVPACTVTMFETSYSTNSAPKNHFILHFTSQGAGVDLRPTISHFVDLEAGVFCASEGGQKPLLACYFNLPSGGGDIKVKGSEGYPTTPEEKRVWLCDAPCGEADVDKSVENARKTFSKIMQEEMRLRGLDQATIIQQLAEPEPLHEVRFNPNVFLPRLRDPEGQQPMDDPEAVMLGVTDPMKQVEEEKEKEVETEEKEEDEKEE